MRPAALRWRSWLAAGFAIARTSATVHAHADEARTAGPAVRPKDERPEARTAGPAVRPKDERPEARTAGPAVRPKDERPEARTAGPAVRPKDERPEARTAGPADTAEPYEEVRVWGEQSAGFVSRARVGDGPREVTDAASLVESLPGVPRPPGSARMTPSRLC